MIYPQDFEQKLGFDQIRQKLKSYSLSDAGAGWVDRMRFSTDGEFIKTLLHQNLEFRQILEKGEEFPSRYFFDATDWLHRISIDGSYLEAAEFLNLGYSLETILACRNFLVKSKEIYPQLFRLTEQISITNELSKHIFSLIDDKAFVKDSASPDLGKIRKKLRDE